jgi:hypothetical protein
MPVGLATLFRVTRAVSARMDSHSAVFTLGATVVGIIAFRHPQFGALQRSRAIVAVVLGTVVGRIHRFFVLVSEAIFMDTPGWPAVGTGEPLAPTDPNGDFLVDLMETRCYKRDREIVRTGFALGISHQDPFPLSRAGRDVHLSRYHPA